MRTWQSEVACALSKHCQPCKQSSWSQELTGEQAFSHSKWCGHPKPHLDYGCFMRKGLEFAPQQLPGIQSQLGGLVGLVRGRWKIRWKIARVELELWPWAKNTTTTPHIHHTSTHIPHICDQTVCSNIPTSQHLVRNERKILLGNNILQ